MATATCSSQPILTGSEKCRNYCPSQKQYAFNKLTKEVFDDCNNLIGYGEIKDGYLQLQYFPKPKRNLMNRKNKLIFLIGIVVIVVVWLVLIN